MSGAREGRRELGGGGGGAKLPAVPVEPNPVAGAQQPSETTTSPDSVTDQKKLEEDLAWSRRQLEIEREKKDTFNRSVWARRAWERVGEESLKDYLETLSPRDINDAVKSAFIQAFLKGAGGYINLNPYHTLTNLSLQLINSGFVLDAFRAGFEAGRAQW